MPLKLLFKNVVYKGERFSRYKYKVGLAAVGLSKPPVASPAAVQGYNLVGSKKHGVF